MRGERDLEKLRRHMAPTVHPDTFVYCCFPDFRVPSGMTPVSTFVESEGLTAIVPKSQAESGGVEFQFESSLITLTVHSSLEAVGFLAVIGSALAAKGVPCNVVSAYHHDHLFVPKARTAETLEILAVLAGT